MLAFDQHGYTLDPAIIRRIFPAIHKGQMEKVRGIVVHQTGGPSAHSAFSSYLGGNTGAHFLIDKDGAIYQTASIRMQAWHVGKLRSRCLAELKCSPTEFRLLKKFDPSTTHQREMTRQVPARYPSNTDSLGIELVGEALPRHEPDPDLRTYEAVTKAQQISLAWLVRELQVSLQLSTTEVFRHPTVSYKNKTEAATASW